jgi:hypothetical protein
MSDLLNKINENKELALQLKDALRYQFGNKPEKFWNILTDEEIEGELEKRLNKSNIILKKIVDD